MLPGIVGWSLIFELLIFYYALYFLFPNTDKKWVYLFLGLVVLISFSDLTPGRWVEIFNGHFDFFWTEILSNFGFR